MMRYMKLLFPFLFVFTVGLFQVEKPAVEEITCLDPGNAIGYEYRYEEPVRPSLKGDVEIPKDWVPQLDYRDMTKPYHQGISYLDIIPTDDFVWVNAFSLIYKLEISTGEISTYDLGERARNLMMTSQGDLWANFRSTKSSTIYRYDEQRDEFKEVVFHGGEGSTFPGDSDNEDFYHSDDKLIELSPNELWYLYDGKLFRLDVSELVATLEFDWPPGVFINQIASGPEKGSLWIVRDYGNALTVYLYMDSQLEIAGYLPSKPFDFPPVDGIESDNANRLWVSNKAMIEILADPETGELDPKHTKTVKILENRLFIGAHPNFSEVYYSANMASVLSDGSVWFSSEPGLVRLQPETGEWCMVARGVSSDVAEGPDDSIWFASEGQLYRHGP